MFAVIFLDVVGRQSAPGIHGGKEKPRPVAKAGLGMGMGEG
jgi:hypothetical protein